MRHGSVYRVYARTAGGRLALRRMEGGEGGSGQGDVRYRTSAHDGGRHAYRGTTKIHAVEEHIHM